jgi:hypothetical protein
MSDPERPPLPAIVYELIEEQLRKIDERHEQTLLVFSVDPTLAPGKRAPAQQPRKLMNALEVYASNLFVAEAEQYGEFRRDVSYSRWMFGLVDRTIRRIFETIALLQQRPNVRLEYHGLTDDEIRAGLNTLLMRAANEYVWKASQPSQVPIQPALSGTALIPSRPILSDQLKALQDEARLTAEQIAESLEIQPRSVFRHLGGQATPRRKQIAAYERLFTERLGRAVRLETSVKRQ